MAFNKKEIPMIIHAHLGTLGQSSRMTSLDLNVVGWGTNAPKFDLRRWTEDGEIDVKSKGATLTLQELRELKDILNSIDLDEDIPIVSFGTPVGNKENLKPVREVVLKERKQGKAEENDGDTTLPW